MRYFVRVSDPQMLMAARPMFEADPSSYAAWYSTRDPSLVIADLSDEEADTAHRSGATVYRDFRLDPVPARNPFDRRRERSRGALLPGPALIAAPAAPPPWQTSTLRDVMDHVHAPAAWARSRGQGVTIAIVDTGVAGAMNEFPGARRSASSVSYAYPGDPWSDIVGHGSMCASIAAGGTAAGGRYDGVAPDATILSARTTFWATDLYKIYEHLLNARRSGSIGPLVVSNSYGYYTCSAPPGIAPDHPFPQIVRDLVADGAVVVFAAGNNHGAGLCLNDPTKCSPNTIWVTNSMDQVLAVGTVDWNNRMDSGAHQDSSRGPGQWAVARPKPDCVAPTYGEVVWGAGYSTMEWWGTSGACPQVAGLAALLLSINPGLSPNDIGNVIRSTCTPIGLGATCAGAGLIQCDRAVAAV